MNLGTRIQYRPHCHLYDGVMLPDFGVHTTYGAMDGVIWGCPGMLFAWLWLVHASLAKGNRASQMDIAKCIR
jgi:hypothetical protein